MGAVYAVEGTSGEGERAIKLLHREFVKEEQVVSRFYAEAEASRRLDHPNIARVFESGQTAAGEPFLLMELLRGKPLADANPEGQRMAVADAIPVIQEVLQALTAAHAQEIVHRDLKPDNVFLCDRPGGGHVAKLLDFGIARVIDAAGGGMRKTRTGMLLGTPGYMSPEQLRNSKSVDPRSDLWSLNTVFYELLSGRDPYGATNDFARLTAVFTQDAIPVDRDVPALAPWRPFFERAFARDINHRFQSAGEMSAAIAAIARGEPLPPPHPPLGSQPPAQGALDATAPAGFQVPHSLSAAPPPPSRNAPYAPHAPPPSAAMPAYGPDAGRPSFASMPGMQTPSMQPGMPYQPGTPYPPGAPYAPGAPYPPGAPYQPGMPYPPGAPYQPGMPPYQAMPTPAGMMAPGQGQLAPGVGHGGSNRLVWALIVVVLGLGAIIVFLAIRSMQDDTPRGGANPGGTTTAAPARPGKHR